MKKIYIPKRYIPKSLTSTDKKTIRDELRKSRKGYKKRKYHTRKRISSFKSKPSSHVLNAQRIYNIDSLKPSTELAQKTGCPIHILSQIEKKGQGAYYSSGSRPNQTSYSWGRARLASSITGGKSAAVDYHLLQQCDKTKKAYVLARRAKRTHKQGKRKVPKTTLSYV